MERGYLIEQFGRVRSHQAYALSFHLMAATDAFDRQYQKTFGSIETQTYFRDRNEFQRSVADNLLKLFNNDSGIPTYIETKSISTMPYGNIRVHTESKFEYSN